MNVSRNAKRRAKPPILYRFLLDAAAWPVRVNDQHAVFGKAPMMPTEHDRVRLRVLEVGIDQWAAYQRSHVAVRLTGEGEGQRELDDVSRPPFPLDDEKIACLGGKRLLIAHLRRGPLGIRRDAQMQGEPGSALWLYGDCHRAA